MHDMTHRYINQAEGWQASCSCGLFTANASTFRHVISLAIEHLDAIKDHA